MNVQNLENAIKYHYGKFPPKDVCYTPFINELLGATDAIARYDQMLKGLHNSEILLAPLRNQEAVISSRMEGTVSTMDEILRYEADHAEEDSQATNVRAEIIETILYQRALRNAQNAMRDGYQISSSMIKNIHQQLLSYGRGAQKSPGQFKNEKNFLADKYKQKILFIPISPEKLNDGLENLFRYIHDSTDPAIIKTAITHIEFEALHPFQDGNGRIGRMLITLMLWDARLIKEPHFYISGYFEERKDEYIDTMRMVSKTGDWSIWIKFFLQAIEEQAKNNLNVAESIQKLYEEMKQVFTDALASKYTVNALDYIFTYPVFRNNKFASISGIPIPTASRFTRTLLEKNIISVIEEASGRRPALYSFEPLMKLVRV